MNKESRETMIRFFTSTLWFLNGIWTCCWMVGCAGGRAVGGGGAPVAVAIAVGPGLAASSIFDPHSPPLASRWALRWSTKVRGAISGMSLSQNGNALWVASSPDSDIEGSAKNYLLTRWSLGGRSVASVPSVLSVLSVKKAWELSMKFPVKDHDGSADGSFLVVSNYENQIIGMNEKGKTLWTVEGTCRPRVIQRTQNILCYHDDDAEPHVAFDLLDRKGKKLLSFPIAHDILAMKVSADEQNLAIAVTGGGVSLLGPDYQPLWEKTLQGEVMDVAVSSGAEPQVAVLYRDSQGEGHISLLDRRGSLIGAVSPSFRAIQVEIESQGNFAFYYGNSALGNRTGQFASPFGAQLAGQWVGRADLAASKELWVKGGAATSEYSSQISLANGDAWFGYSENSLARPSSSLLALDAQGVLRAEIPLQSGLGASLYHYKLALPPHGLERVLPPIGAGILAVGSDDARLSVYSLK